MQLYIRWFLLVLFCFLGSYYLMWMVQSADFSVPSYPDAPYMTSIYHTRALFALPIAILFFAVGVLFFLCLRK